MVLLGCLVKSRLGLGGVAVVIEDGLIIWDGRPSPGGGVHLFESRQNHHFLQEMKNTKQELVFTT